LCSLLFFLYEKMTLYVKSNDMLSDPFSAFNGTPQGDNLSPLLFSLYTADLPSCLPHIGPTLNNVQVPYLLFADDTTVLASDKDELQIAIDAFTTYCDEYDLQINPTKTKYLVFHKGRLPKKSNVYLRGIHIPRVNTATYLGITFSSRLSFSAHARKFKDGFPSFPPPAR
jgi:hypothetical protein